MASNTEEDTTDTTISKYKRITVKSKLDIFCYPGLNDVISEQVQAWVDATDNLEDINSTPATYTNVDQQMICDIQRTISRLIGKAPQLIGIRYVQIYLCLTI